MGRLVGNLPLINRRLLVTLHFIPHYRKESHMNKADIDRLIAIEVHSMRACVDRLCELYPPIADPNKANSGFLASYILKDSTGDHAIDALGWSEHEIMKLLGIAKDYASLLDT
jgi:hypothetical protein